MNFPSVSQFSVAKGTGGTNPPEMYVPLWWYSGSDLQVTGSSVYYMQKGNLGTPVSPVILHSLNSTWSSNIKYSLEASLSVSNNTTGANAQLYDITTSSVVSGSGIVTSATNMTILRSSQFTLIPGHKYGVQVWVGTPNYYTYITDVSLIVFPS